MKTLLLATRSAGKLRELRALLAGRVGLIDLEEAGVAESPVEDDLERFSTFEENALAKARFFHACTQRPTIADDSGLVVDALGGGPGVYSKRWSGRADLAGQALDDENNRLLLERLAGVAGVAGVGDRCAHYVCVAVYVDDAHALVARGEVHGEITRTPRGCGGFGYDPYFAATELEGRTFGEASLEEKAGVSHRGRAFRALFDQLDSGGLV